MIDFTGVSALRIPEGNVTKITNASGTVLWEKVEENYTYPSYIKFNADMVFDTGVRCSQNTKIEVRFTRETSETRYLFGAIYSDNTKTVAAVLGTNGEWRFGGGYKKLTMSNATTVRNVTMDGSKLVYGSSNYSYTGTVGTFYTPYSLTLGAARTAAGADPSPQFIGKIYYFRMYSGDTLVLDWIPCQKADGTLGFYDNVKKKFVNRL